MLDLGHRLLAHTRPMELQVLLETCIFTELLIKGQDYTLPELGGKTMQQLAVVVGD
jgi:hypothetical protein